MNQDYSKYFVESPKHGASDSDSLDAIEEIAGIDIRHFFSRHGGCRFGEFAVYPHRELIANVFDLHQTINPSMAIDCFRTNEDLFKNSLIPFATDHYGNQFCISVNNKNSVVFYDHENGDIFSVANNLDHLFTECILPS